MKNMTRILLAAIIALSVLSCSSVKLLKTEAPREHLKPVYGPYAVVKADLASARQVKVVKHWTKKIKGDNPGTRAQLEKFKYSKRQYLIVFFYNYKNIDAKHFAFTFKLLNSKKEEIKIEDILYAPLTLRSNEGVTYQKNWLIKTEKPLLPGVNEKAAYPIQLVITYPDGKNAYFEISK